MILRSLTVRNFRSFVGEQKLVFAPPGDHNVTVVYGANGAGKTTLLNAFTWALFESVTPAFENPSRLLNDRVRSELSAGAAVEVSVTVEFEHDGRSYMVSRSQKVERDPAGNFRDQAPKGRVIIQTRDETTMRDDVASVVGQILPSKLHQFFFFDGERIEKLVQADGATQLEGAIKTILGLEVLERAISHLPEAKKLIRAELKRSDLGETLAELLAAVERLEKDQHLADQDLETARANVLALERQYDTIERLIRENAVARERQLRLDALRSEEKSLKEQIGATRRGTKNILSNRAFSSFCADLATRAGAAVEDLRQKGRLPAPFERRFVLDLLEANACLCGTALPHGSEIRARVEGMSDSGGREELQQAWNNIASEAERLAADRPRVCESLREIVRQIGELDARLALVRNDIDRLEAEQRESGDAAVADYASQRDRLKGDIRDLHGRTAILETVERETREAHREAGERLKRARTGDERGQVLQRRLESADRIESAIRAILAVRRERTREQLDERVKETYKDIAYKPYVPELTAAFQLSLRTKVGTLDDVLVNKSQGENQILALSFVGALARLAKERFEEREASQGDGLSSFEGGIFPIVMDSPFGALDENYRREVAHAIPRLAPQVVTFVSKSQGLGVVQAELASKVGREYVIAYQTPKDDVRAETIELSGSTYEYISYAGDGFEAASLNEVSIGVA